MWKTVVIAFIGVLVACAITSVIPKLSPIKAGQATPKPLDAGRGSQSAPQEPLVLGPKSKQASFVDALPALQFPGSPYESGEKGEAARAATAPPGAIYFDGAVMNQASVYAIYWQPPGYEFPPGYQELINRYFNDVANSTSADISTLKVATQYESDTGPIQKPTFAGAISDTSPLPQQICSDGDAHTPACITDDQIESEIQAVQAAHGLAPGLGHAYFLITPPGIGSCTPWIGQCSYTGYCAYHGVSFQGTGAHVSQTIYADLPYAAADSSDATCDHNQRPNNNPADATINMASHELAEMLTDPAGEGWLYGGVEEISDICQWQFGDILGATDSGGIFNQEINGHPYFAQPIWSNTEQRCVFSDSPVPVPKLHLRISRKRVRVGQLVSFAVHVKGASEYQWLISNSELGSQARARFRFRKPGRYPITIRVTLATTNKVISKSRTVRVIRSAKSGQRRSSTGLIRR